MKKETSLFFSIAFVLLFISIPTIAQKNLTINNSYISNNIKSDGVLTEWSDSLKYSDPTTKLSYTVGNDDTNLYVAIKTSDAATIRKIFSFGLGFGISKEGKKKLGPTITYPIIDVSAVRATIQKNAQAKKKQSDLEITKQLISKVSGVRVDGFPEILDGNISINNEYGIHAGATIDDKNTFRYELIIPLTLLELTSDFKDEMLYNIKVNGAQRTVIEQGMRPMSSRRYGGYGGYGYGGYGGYGDRETYRRTISETVQSWVKFTLAQP